MLLAPPRRRLIRPHRFQGVNYASPQARGLYSWWPLNTPHSWDAVDVIDGFDLANQNSVPRIGTIHGPVPSWTYASTHHFLRDTPRLTAHPLTFVAIFKLNTLPSVTGDNHSLLTQSDFGGANNFWSLSLDNTTDRCIAREKRGGTTRTAEAALTVQVETWYYAAAVFNGTTDRRVYINGVKGTDTGSVAGAPTGMDNTVIGALKITGTIAVPFDGEIADVRMYNIGWTDQDYEIFLSNPWDLYARPVRRVFFVPSGVTFEDAAGTLAGVSTISGTVDRIRDAAGTLAASSTLAAAASAEKNAAGTLADAFTFVALGQRIRNTASALAASSTLAVVAAKTANVAGVLVSVSTVPALAERVRDVAGTLAGTSALSGTGEKVKDAAGTLVAVSSFSAVADDADAAGTLTATSTLTGSAGATRSAAGTLAGVSMLSAAGGKIVEAQGTLAASSTLSAAANRERNIAGALAGVSALAGAGSATVSGAGTLAAQSALVAMAAATRSAQAVMAAISTISAETEGFVSVAGTLSGNSTLNAAATAERNAAAVLVAVSSLPAVAAQKIAGGDANMESVSTILVAASAEKSIAGSLSAISVFYADPRVGIPGYSKAAKSFVFSPRNRVFLE